MLTTPPEGNASSADVPASRVRAARASRAGRRLADLHGGEGVAKYPTPSAAAGRPSTARESSPPPRGGRESRLGEAGYFPAPAAACPGRGALLYPGSRPWCRGASPCPPTRLGA